AAGGRHRAAAVVGRTRAERRPGAAVGGAGARRLRSAPGGRAAGSRGARRRAGVPGGHLRLLRLVRPGPGHPEPGLADRGRGDGGGGDRTPRTDPRAAPASTPDAPTTPTSTPGQPAAAAGTPAPPA